MSGSDTASPWDKKGFTKTMNSAPGNMSIMARAGARKSTLIIWFQLGTMVHNSRGTVKVSFGGLVTLTGLSKKTVQRETEWLHEMGYVPRIRVEGDVYTYAINPENFTYGKPNAVPAFIEMAVGKIRNRPKPEVGEQQVTRALIPAEAKPKKAAGRPRALEPTSSADRQRAYRERLKAKKAATQLTVVRSVEEPKELTA